MALAKRQRPDLDIAGLDLSSEKIDAARRAFSAAGMSVRHLAVQDIGEFPEQSLDVITIIDVLYLVPRDRWDALFAKCFRCLRPGGRLLLKEMDPSIRWKFGLLYLEEVLAVRVLGLTKGDTFTFPSRAAVSECLRRAGFSVEDAPIDSGYYVPHCLWVATR